MAFTDKFIYMAHQFIRLRLNPFDLSIDRADGGLSTLVSYLWVSLSADGAKNVSWPWLSPLP